VRLARAGLGGVEYWSELPFSELVNYMDELVEQLEQEAKAAKRG
jgi:hypothetical protein